GDLLVPRRQPAAAEPAGVRDRAALPQVVLDQVRVGGPLGFEVREVGGPVRDRPRDDLVARAEGTVSGLIAGVSRKAIVVAPRADVFGKSVVNGHASASTSTARSGQLDSARRASRSAPGGTRPSPRTFPYPSSSAPNRPGARS